MAYSPRYNVEQGSLIVDHLDEDGNCVQRTRYTPERFAQERHDLPASVVKTYEGGSSSSAEARGNNDMLTASNEPRDLADAPPAKKKAAKKTAAKKTAVKKAAVKKTAVKKTTKR